MRLPHTIYNDYWWILTLHACKRVLHTLISSKFNILGRHFADDVFKFTFANINCWILIRSSLKYIPSGPINSNPVLVEIMACRRTCNKPLSEPKRSSLLTHTWVTQRVSELGHPCFRQWLVTYWGPSHYQSQWWLNVNWTLGNKLQRQLNSPIFTQEI